MSTRKTYRIGNGLRGHFIFKARGLKEAWKIGCSTWNKSFGPEGRIVYLSVKVVSPLPLPTTKWVKDQLAKPQKERYFADMVTIETAEYWLTVAYGLSTEPLLLP